MGYLQVCKIFKNGQTDGAAFFGMELGRKDVFVFHGSVKYNAVVACCGNVAFVFGT
jgi:hypothetical protein